MLGPFQALQYRDTNLEHRSLSGRQSEHTEHAARLDNLWFVRNLEPHSFFGGYQENSYHQR
ncbi:MAG: hypothetical protein BWZ03_00473 [bacterium ADurb.BinA186]|nr:MAG: hypothetical protein BWZ03_00473 [bacterium ADurb.BinA186]